MGSKSAEVIGHNEDILIQILLNLPAKSLIKFKLVCKQWMSLISDNEFCLAHTRSLLTKGPLEPSALFFDDFHLPSSGFSYLPLTPDFIRLPSFDFTGILRIEIRQSCNGLLLYRNYRKGGFFICNPITKMFKMLTLPNPGKDYELIGVSLAFDPLKSPHHKIISICGLELPRDMWSEREILIDIYSSENDSWSSSIIKFTCAWSMRFDHGIFFKGAIYWDCRCLDLYYFDVENKCLKTMPTPFPIVLLCNDGERYFGESGGSLNFEIAEVEGFSIYEMAEDHSDWNLKHHLNYNLFSPEYGLERFKRFCAIRSADGYSIFILCRDGTAMSYNFKDGTKRELHYCPNDGILEEYHWFEGSQYIETLLVLCDIIWYLISLADAS